MIYGYARVSTKEQNLDRQFEALMNAGVENKNIFIDKLSGKNFDRPQYQYLRSNLKENDLLIIKAIDRLGRNYREILDEWRYITTEIKADIKVIDMPLLDTTLHKDLIGTFISDLILQVLSYVAQQERDYIKMRQEEGIKIAKEKGKHLGRPRIELSEEAKNIITIWKNGEITAKKAMDTLNLKRTTFYKLIKDIDKGS